MTTRHHRDGSAFEQVAGYARAVRRGTRIAVSGTTAPGDALGGPDETLRQTTAALHHALAAVVELGGSRDDVIRSRLLLAPTADWRAAAQAHVEVLGDIAPANTTLYVAALLGEGAIVEVELDAEVEDPADAPHQEAQADPQEPGS